MPQKTFIPIENDLNREYVATARERGYRSFVDHFRTDGVGYMGSLQRRMTDAEGTRYFLNIDMWDFGAVTRGHDPRLSAEGNLQFHTRDDMEGDYINIQMNASDLEAFEAMAERIWKEMGFGYYEREPVPAP